MSNFTDFDALAAEPGVRVRFTLAPVDVLRADLLIVPGSKHTIGDLRLLRECGVANAIEERARRGLPMIGICAGYQMLGETIHDDFESREGEVPGLGLLPVRTRFQRSKVLANRAGVSPHFGSSEVRGYQIHNGRVVNEAVESLVTSPEGDDGAVVGNVAGTSWHGIFDSDAFRSAVLAWVAAERGLAWKPSGLSFHEFRLRSVDRVADAIDATLDLDAFATILSTSRPQVPTPMEV
jgi:adenosylcobyric acid synthase